MSAPHFGCAAGIHAATGAAHWPRGLLADLHGKPLIQRVYERTRAATLLDEVFVLASSSSRDDELVAFLEAREIPYRRAAGDDRLARHIALVEERAPRFVVCVDGASVFADRELIDLQLGALRAFDADLVHATDEHGARLENAFAGQRALSARALRRAEASDDARAGLLDGTHFLPRHARAFEGVEIELEEAPGELARPLRTAADLAWARALWSAVDHEGDGLFPLGRARRWLASRGVPQRPPPAAALRSARSDVDGGSA